MTRYNQQILFTALAFFAVVIQDGENLREGSAQKIKLLAELLGDFCAENVPSTYANSIVSPTDESDVTDIDAEIQAHIKEQLNNGKTALPTDREMLYKLYERLQLRKVRRINAVLFEVVSNKKLAHLVQSQINAEIHENGGLL